MTPVRPMWAARSGGRSVGRDGRRVPVVAVGVEVYRRTARAQRGDRDHGRDGRVATAPPGLHPSALRAPRTGAVRAGTGRLEVRGRGEQFGSGPRPRRGHRDQCETHQQPFGGHEPRAVSRAHRAFAGVAGQPLAPQGGGDAVPAGGDVLQQHARRFGRQRAHHDPRRLQLGLHPLHPYGGVLRGEFESGGDLGAGQMPGGLQPPQRKQGAVVLVQPARRLRDLTALAGQAELQDRQLDEVRPGIRQVVRGVQPVRRYRTRLPLTPVRAYLVHGYRHQPGTETLRVAQFGQAPEHPQHRLLHHVVHVRMTVQRASDDVVQQRQVRRDELVLGLLVAPCAAAIKTVG